MNTRRFLLAIAVAAVVGWSIFGYLVARVSSFQELRADLAEARFDSVRALYDGGTESPQAAVDALDSTAVARGEVRTLHLMLYQHSVDGLLQIDVPLWFLKLKGPALQFALRGTDIDLEELGLTADQLQERGPAIVADQLRANGDRLLAWTDSF